MLLSLMALLVSGNVTQDNARVVFNRVERPILKCKTFKAQFELFAEPDKNIRLKGRLLVAQGNKMLLEMDGFIQGMHAKHLIVSDGIKVRSADLLVSNGKKVHSSEQEEDTPKQYTEKVLASVTRTGFYPAVILPGQAKDRFAKKKPLPNIFNLDKEHPVSDVKFGKREMVYGKQTQALDYIVRIMPMSEERLATVTVWIDVKTNLPLKRVITIKKGEAPVVFTEAYRNVALDEHIDDGNFKVRK